MSVAVNQLVTRDTQPEISEVQTHSSLQQNRDDTQAAGSWEPDYDYKLTIELGIGLLPCYIA